MATCTKRRSKAQIKRQGLEKKRRVAAGACANCGKPREEERKNRRLCIRCGKLISKRASAKRNRSRKAALALGLCGICFHNEPMPGTKWCARCAELRLEASARHRERNRERGICSKCRTRLTEDERARGLVNCARHRQLQLKATQKYQENHRRKEAA